MQWTLALSALATAALAMPHKRQEESINEPVLTYNETVVFHHNLHRANHSSVNITWDEEIASTAQKIANTCNFEHQMNFDGGGYGQNLAAGIAAENISYIITNMFYNGEAPSFADFYNMTQPPSGNFAEWGHFSQLVWNGSSTIGCATQYCPNGVANTGSRVPPYLTVCNYKGAGNVQGQYADNIGEPLGLPTATWANSTGVPACSLLNCTLTPAQYES